MAYNNDPKCWMVLAFCGRGLLLTPHHCGYVNFNFTTTGAGLPSSGDIYGSPEVMEDALRATSAKLRIFERDVVVNIMRKTKTRGGLKVELHSVFAVLAKAASSAAAGTAARASNE